MMRWSIINMYVRITSKNEWGVYGGEGEREMEVEMEI